MRCFYMFKGLPGCGKSTEAKKLRDSNPDSCHIVERDSIREFFGFMGQPFSRDNEQRVTDEQERLLHEIMRIGDDDVISSDTNFNPKCEKLYLELCEKYGYEFIVKDMTNVPIEVCIYQDSKRTGPKCVGEKVIRDMAARYGVCGVKKEEKKNRGPIPVTDPQPEFSRGIPPCIIVDIDGTVARHVNRSPYDETKVLSDIPRFDVIFTIKALSLASKIADQNLKIFFFSGRTKACQDDTETWLITKADFNIENIDWELDMREIGDTRKDSIVKNELFDKHVRGKYNCIGVFDDRPQVIEECWLPKGLTVYNVGDGSIF